MTNPVNALVIANLKKTLEDAQAIASAIEENAQNTGEGITREEAEAIRNQLYRIIRTVGYARLLTPYRPRRKPPTWRSWAVLGALLTVLGIALANRAIDELNKPLSPRIHHG